MKNITGVINNQMIHPFNYEEQDMANISTGHKSKSADLVSARGKGMGTTLVAARETGSEKLTTYNWSHLQESVFLFRKRAFSLVISLWVVYLERYCARQTTFFSIKSEWGPTLF